MVPGGFVLPRCWQLHAAFWFYRQGHLPLRAVRVWLALWELKARRCTLGPKRRPNFRSDEVLRLIGGGGRRAVRADVRSLRKLGLVSFSAGQLRFPETPEQLPDTHREQLQEQLKNLPNRARRVPLPRRVVRFLAGAGTRALLSTALGEAMRLLYFKDGVVSARGRSKASWLAETFGVDERNVKRARAHLEALGIITPEAPASGYERVQERRWGRVAHWNLSWSGTKQEAAEQASCTDLPPVVAKTDTGLPPVESDNTLLPETKNQNPALCGPAAGFCTEAAPAKAPSIRDITEHDLTTDERTQALFEDAAARQLIEKSQAGQLRFFGLVEHARRYGTKNRPGLLRSLLTKKQWFITQDDEELARRRLKRFAGEVLPRARNHRDEEAENRASVNQVLARAKALLRSDQFRGPREGPPLAQGAAKASDSSSPLGPVLGAILAGMRPVSGPTAFDERSALLGLQQSC
jgi:hypothetical protein